MSPSFRPLVVDIDDAHGDGGAVVNVGDDDVGTCSWVRWVVLDYGADREFGVG